MSYNGNNSKHPQRLAKRVPHEVDMNPQAPVAPPPYNPYDSSGPAAPHMYNSYDSSGPAAPPIYNPYQPAQHMYENVPPQAYYNSNAPYGAPNPQNPGFAIPSQYLSETLVANAAMQYGQHLMGTGKQYVDNKIEKFVPVTRLKYYFAVDTSYVIQKLRLLFFPFSNKEWSLRYSTDEPIQPRFEVNAPDLYIPTMAYLTYVLVAGFALGTQDRFTPESLGIQASSALAWTILEVAIYLICFYVLNVSTSMTTIDILAFSGYKFVGIIFSVLGSLIFLKTGYYCALIYSSLSLSYFLMRTLKGKILSINNPTETGNTRRLYLLLSMAFAQPFLMWFLSYHLIAPNQLPLSIPP